MRKVYTLLSIPALMAGMLLPTSPASAATDILCIAHRGGDETGHTEETIDTYRNSLDAGVPEVEGDIHFSSTGYPYLLHDTDMGVFDKDDVLLKDVSGTTAKTYVSDEGDVIASLAEVADLLRQYPDASAQFELKETPPSQKSWDLINARIGDMKDRVRLSSFAASRLATAKASGYRTIYATNVDVKTKVAPTVAQNSSTLSTANIRAYHALGMKVAVWTPGSVARWNVWKARGVDEIYTDHGVACTNWNLGE